MAAECTPVDTSPAGTLRRAATKLRTLSAAATPGPWTYSRWHSDSCPENCDDPTCFLLLVGSAHGLVGDVSVDREPEVFAVERSVQERGEDDARYIGTMHPLVGAALADWLELEAAVVEGRTAADDPDAVDGGSEYALTVARALLGEQR